jgi:hypothetical protein
LFFKYAIEIFKSIPSLEIMNNSPKVTSHPKLVQAPTSPSTPRNPVIPKRHLEKSQSVINIWFQLFFDILGDDQITDKLCNTLYLILGNEGTPETIVRTNLPEKNTRRIQRRKVRIGKKFRLEVRLDDFEIKDVILDLGSDVNILPKNT